MENTNGDMEFILICGGVLCLCLFICTVMYFTKFGKTVADVKRKMARAEGWNEYTYWRRELSAIRWCMIPGLTPKKVKRIRRFLRKYKMEKQEEKSDGFMPIFISSVSSICFCAICLVGCTFAWFTASESTAPQSIQAANYSVSVKVDSMDWNDTGTLEKGTYTIKITTTGSATTGYCIVHLGESELHTVPIPKGSSLTFQLDIKEVAEFKILPQWGSSSRPEEEKIKERVEPYSYGTAAETLVNVPDNKEDTNSSDGIETNETTSSPEMTQPEETPSSLEIMQSEETIESLVTTQPEESIESSETEAGEGVESGTTTEASTKTEITESTEETTLES